MNIAVGHTPRRVLAALAAAALALAGLAITASPADAADTTRFEGDNRYQTAEAIATAGWGGGEADGAIVASGSVPGDMDFFAINALVSASLAGQVDGPVLLTNPAELSAAVERSLEDVLGDDGGPVYVVGDDVSEAVETELTDLGYDVTRIGGADQYETAANVAREVGSDGVAEFNDLRTGVVATGNDFPDTLAGGPIAYQGHPFFLINNDDDSVPEATSTALEELDIEQVLILGDENAVSTSVEEEIEDIVGNDALRAGGDNRVQTAAAVAQLAVDEFGFDLDEILLASGYENGGIDAIAGGPYGGLTLSPILLVQEDSLPEATENFLSTNDTQSSTLIGLGDDAVIDQEVLEEAEAVAEASEGEGPVQTFTDGPEVTSVTVDSQTSGSVNLRYTFDEDVAGKTPAAGCFHLYAFDHQDFAADAQNPCAGGHAGDDNTNPASADGANALIDEDTPSEVVVRYNVDRDEFAQVTITTVDWDAVQDAEGTENLEGVLPIGEGVSFDAGTTSAPDLVQVGEFDTTANTVEFVFDEDVDTATLDGTGFSLIDENGDDVLTSTAATVQDDPSVVDVTFDDVMTDTEASTARAAVEADTVTGEDGNTNPQQTVDVSNDGLTDAPDLESVTFDFEDNTAVYDFDANVALTGDADAFNVYDRTGEETDASSVTRSAEDTSVVEATFEEGALDSQVGASVDAGAVQSTTGAENQDNQVDEVAVSGQDFAAGETTGPELTTARVEFGGDAFAGSDLSVVFTFDEDVDTADATSSDRFFVYDEDGAPTRASDVETSGTDDTLEDNEVRATFGEDNDAAASAAVVATVNDQAVTGEDGTLTNPEGVAGIENAEAFTIPDDSGSGS